MADLFQKPPTPTRDPRLREATEPVEPMVSQTATIPVQQSPIQHVIGEHIEIDEDPITPIVRDEDQSHLHLFSSYSENPKHISFHNQIKDEAILLFLRESHITNVVWVIQTLLLFCAPFILFSIFPLKTTPLVALPLGALVLLTLVYYHIICSFAFVKFLQWYFNISLLTNQRIIDIDFTNLVYKNVAETKIALVQDVSYTQTNVAHTLFNYGNVLIQTAGYIENFELHSVPNPERVVEVLENIIGKGREVL